MKIVYFVVNGQASIDDKSKSDLFRKDGHKCIFSNGSIPYGFEDSCDAVFLSADFPHIEKWAVSNGVEVMKPIAAVEPEPELVVEPEQETKPRRGRKPTAVEKPSTEEGEE